MTNLYILILCAIFGYLAGSVPFGLVLTRLAGYGDIRKIGSGNIGATNVLRTGNKTLALLTVLLDAFKAGIAAYIAYHCTNTDFIKFLSIDVQFNVLASLIAGTMGIIGHNFPVWLKFKGGKGVASALGFLLITNWQLGLLLFAIWLTVAFISRYSSLSALTAAAFVPVYSLLFLPTIYAVFFTAIAVLIILRHHANIYRLIHGEESKISFKKKA